jgi:hypothetical protein
MHVRDGVLTATALAAATLTTTTFALTTTTFALTTTTGHWVDVIDRLRNIEYL